MYRGIYGASSAMLVQEKTIDVVSNNLANVDTVGFRRRISVEKTFPEVLIQRRESLAPFEGASYQPIGLSGLNVVLSQTAMDTSEGAIEVTGNPLDVAISGDGFFVVGDRAGNVFYTRAGNFALDSRGNLVTQEGLNVLGRNGAPISVANVSFVEIDEGGSVIADGNVVGRVGVVTFQNPTYLRNVGKSLLQASAESGGAQPVGAARLVPRALERSNVNVVYEMVRLIEGQRAYEAAARSLSIQDEQTGSLITTFGRS